MKHKSFFTLLAAALMTMSAWAIGPQSLKVTFDGTDNAGWNVSSGGSIISTENGIMNVQMADQGNNSKGEWQGYRADLQYQIPGTYTFDKSKDIVWAVKLTGALPGSSNSRKFEVNYKKEGANTWINGINGPSGQIDCTDGGRIYYFNLGTDGLNKLGDVPEGAQTINNIHFIFADAVCDNAEQARYGVDWVATFESVNDLKAFQDWNDEQTNASAPYFEVCFRPKADGTGFDDTRNGFKNIEFEGNYQVRYFAVEYFLVDNFSNAKEYTLALTKTGNYSALSVWDFPYQVTNYTSASEIFSMATDVVGIAPGSTEGTPNAPIASTTCENDVWSFVIPGFKLTPLATVGTKTLVGLFITSQNLTSNLPGKFASQANTTVAMPSFTQTHSYPVFNTTQMVGYATLEAAAAAAAHNDVLEIYENVELGSCFDTGNRALTIQGHTGSEVITRKSNYTGLMFLTTNNENAALTVRNLIVDGNNVATTQQVFESSNSTKLTTLENITIRNVNNSNDFGSAISNKNGGALVLNNVTFQDITCTATTTPSVIFVGTNNVVLKGNNQFINCGEVPAIRVENKYYMTAEGELTNTTPIAIQLGTHIDGNSVVKSCTDKSKFALVNTPFVLASVDGNLVAKDYILMNTTQDLGYNTFADAIAAAADGDVIEIRKDITTPSGRTNIGKAITFKAVNGAVIYNGTSDNNMLFLSQSADGVTFEDIIIDGAGKNRNDVATMEAGTGYKLILKNVTVRNLTSGRDVTVNGYVDLYGNNILPNGIRLNMNKFVTDHETTHTTPIHFSLASDYIENADAVHGTTDYTRYTVSKESVECVEWETYADTEHNQVRVRSIAVPLTYDLTVSAAGMATLVLGFDVPVLPAGVKAYTLTNDGSNVITATEVTSLTANEPVLIIAEAGNYTFESEAGATLDEQANPTNGCLVGTYTDNTSIDQTTGDNYNYILSDGSAGVGFYQVLSDEYSINKNHAYLSCTYDNHSASAAPLRIRFSTETTTDIHSAATDSSVEKLLINGVLYIRKADHIYSIDGMMIR